MKRRIKIWLSALLVVLVLGVVVFVWFQRQSMLTDAAAAGNLTAVRLLFRLGVNLDGRPENDGQEPGEPALLVAVENGHEDVVRFFIEHHADLEVSYSDIQGPLEIAIGNRNYSMAELLLSKGARLRRNWVDRDNWRPPLDDKMFNLLKRYAPKSSAHPQ